jgi:hypothetical protein
MDERFRGNRLWIGLGALAIIFLCVALCGFGAMASMFMRSDIGYAPAPYVQPPAGEEGVVPPPTYYQDHSPLGMGRYGNTGLFGFVSGAIGLLFRLVFFGLLLLLLLGLVKRLFWGPRHHWACYPGRPPKGKEWKGRPHPGWGPWAWHGHGAPWEAEDEVGTQEGEPDPDEYSGPQE